jgi:hypothetical protein
MTNSRKPAVPISGLAHVGVRVHDLERSLRFYALLGFEKTAGRSVRSRSPSSATPRASS